MVSDCVIAADCCLFFGCKADFAENVIYQLDEISQLSL